MVKECDCSIEEQGLPTIYPSIWSHCPFCGEPLKEVAVEDIKKRLRKKLGEDE